MDGTPQYVNPMDMNLNYSEDDSPLALKSDFILSLCELVLSLIHILAFDFLFLHETGRGIACKLRVFMQGFVILEVDVCLKRCLRCV